MFACGAYAGSHGVGIGLVFPPIFIIFAVRIIKIMKSMKELTARQWSDVGYRITNKPCSNCGYSGMYSEPNYGEIGKIDVLTLSCGKCGRVAIYDVAELESATYSRKD